MRRPCAKTFRLVAMTAASAAVAACGLSSANNTEHPAGRPRRPADHRRHLAAAVRAATGTAQGFAPDGQACKKGYELWASDVNSHGGLLGRPVKLIILNDKGDPKTDAEQLPDAHHPGPCGPDAGAVLVAARLAGRAAR